MARDKEKNTVADWLAGTGSARQHHPDELFPTMTKARDELRRALAGGPATTKPTTSASEPKTSGWQLDRTKDVLRAEFPDGVPPNLTDKEVRRRIEHIFKRNGWKLSSVDTIARARGRRERRD